MLWFVPPPPAPAQVQTSAAAAQTVSAPAPTAATAEAYFLFIQGRTLEGKGDVDGAIAAYRKAIALVPEAADVRAELSGLYAREGRAAESIAEAEAALKADPANREAHRILGFVQSALADNAPSREQQASLVTQAIGHFESAVAEGTRDLGVELTLGRLYVRTAQFAKAIPTLQVFLADQPGYPDAVLLLVEAFNATSQFADAVSVLEPLVRDEPDLARARTWLAEMYERVGREADAIPHWSILARTNPKNTTLRGRYATALVNSGQLEQGRQELLALTADAPTDVTAWYLLSQVETRSGHPDAAEAAARRISDLDANDPRGPLALARSHAARGDLRGAADTLDALLRALRDRPAGPIYARVAMELAEVVEKDGDRGRAVRVLEDGRSRVAGDLELNHALAAAYVRDKQFDHGERLYRELLAGSPSDATALTALGYLLADQKKDLAEAVELLQKALADDPDNPAYLDCLGWAFVQQGKADEGRDMLERATRARPADSLAWHHLGEALFQLKRYREAQVAWDRSLAGDQNGIDAGEVTRKRDRAKELAGGL